MQTIIDYGVDIAKQRLKAKNIDCCENICEFILQEICFISFCCLFRNKLVLETPEIEYLNDSIRKKCTHEVRTEEKRVVFNIHPMVIVSSFFSSVGSTSASCDIEYCHKTQQEYLAARYGCQEMIRTHEDVEKIIATSMEKYVRVIESEGEMMNEEPEDEDNKFEEKRIETNEFKKKEQKESKTEKENVIYIETKVEEENVENEADEEQSGVNKFLKGYVQMLE